MKTIPLELSYTLPGPCGDERNERLRTHADLPHLSDWQLETEGHRARLALCFGQFANQWQRRWVAERLRMCQAEARRRRGGAR